MQKQIGYAELKRQIEELTGLAEELRRKESAEAAKQVKELISSYGLTAQDIGLEPASGRKASGGQADAQPQQPQAKPQAQAPKKAKVKRGKYRVLFRDPETGVGWAGRGRIPRWMEARFKEGKTKEDFRIGQPASGR